MGTIVASSPIARPPRIGLLPGESPSQESLGAEWVFCVAAREDLGVVSNTPYRNLSDAPVCGEPPTKSVRRLFLYLESPGVADQLGNFEVEASLTYKKSVDKRLESAEYIEGVPRLSKDQTFLSCSINSSSSILKAPAIPHLTHIPSTCLEAVHSSTLPLQALVAWVSWHLG